MNYYHPARRRELNATLAQQGLRVPTDGEDLETLLNVIVRNTLTILGNIHRLGYVIGDVSESNILVNYEGRVAFVDSRLISSPGQEKRDHSPLPGGKEDFLSPRVIGLTTDDCNLDRCPSGKPRGRQKKSLYALTVTPKTTVSPLR